MNLIERYIYEVGRYIPRRKRGDILAELRSLLVDTLEDRFGQEPSQAQIEDMLKEFGRPRDMAASYYPQSQYLVGPTLYPLFRMVAWIVVASVLGAQALAYGVGMFVAGETFSVLEVLSSLVTSVPISLGWVLITFILLQYFDAKPHLEEDPWDPTKLPEIKPEEELKHVEIILGLVFGVLIMVLVTFFPQWIGIITTPGGKFYPNPVILDHLLLIQIGLVASIGFNVFLLWRRRWGLGSRLLKIALDIYYVVVLGVLVMGHNSWLAARSSGGIFDALGAIEGMADGGWELVGMHAFRLAFVVTLIVTVIEILTSIYRLIKSRLRSDFSPKNAVLRVE